MRQINEKIEERIVHVAKPQKHNFEKTELRLEDIYNNDYVILSECIEDKAMYYLNLEYKEFKTYFKLTYSLSHSQGDGVGFRKGESNIIPPEVVKKILPHVDLRKLQEMNFFIQTNCFATYYCHENTFYICYETYKDYSKKKENYIYDVAKELDENLKEVCRTLETYGYECIEEEDKRQISYLAFERFKELNNLDDGMYLYDFDYTLNEKEATDKYTHVATNGDSYENGLWVMLPQLKQVTKAYVMTKEVVSYEAEE